MTLEHQDLMRKLYDDHKLNDQDNPTHCSCGHAYTEGGRLAQVINHHIIMAASIGWDGAIETMRAMSEIGNTAEEIGKDENPYKENQ